MDEREAPILGRRAALYVALVVFVLAWILGPSFLREAIPIWLPFLVALGLETAFLVGALRTGPSSSPDRGPQAADRERYGFPVGDGEDEEGGDGEDDAADTVLVEERSRLRGFLPGILVIAALALVVWVVEGRTGWNGLDRETRSAVEARLSEEAARIAEKPVSIRCDESRDVVGVVQHADGVAIVGGRLAYLTPERCYDLYRLAFRGDITSARTARAIAVLAHETWHLRGVQDESTTECYALQSGVDLGERLGLSETTARQMMRQQLTENALRAGGATEYRVSPECRDGGPLDLDRADSRFP